MSIYLPFGISLFQANTLQLQSISERQSRLLTRQLSFASLDSQRSLLSSIKSPREMRHRWETLSTLQKGYIYIGIGMVIQVFWLQHDEKEYVSRC